MTLNRFLFVLIVLNNSKYMYSYLYELYNTGFNSY